MGLRLFFVGFCLLIVSSAHGARPPRWTKKFHSETVRSASMRDSLGVSNDRTGIAVWKATTGDSVAYFPATRSEYQQAWLSPDLSSVIAVVRESSQRPVFIYWIELATGVITDSFAVPMPKGVYAPFTDYTANSDISEDGTQLIVTVFWVSSNPPNYTSMFQPTVVDLVSRSVKKVLESSTTSEWRFESHDKKISAFSQSGPAGTTWSPSGVVGFNGSHLVDYPTEGGNTQVTNGLWTTMRWTQSDAVIMAKASPIEKAGSVCLVNLCTNAVIDTVVDATYKYWGFWSHWDMQRCVTYSRNGEVAYWDVPTLPLQEYPCVRNALPDTVRTDSVYNVSSVWFPFSASTKYLMYDEADAAPYTTMLFAWRNEGATSIRFGRIDGADTLWTQRRPLYVEARTLTSSAVLEVATGKGAVSHLHTTRENQILISTLGGRTLIADTSLRCTRGLYSSVEHQAAAWDGDSAILVLQKQISSSGNGPSNQFSVSGRVRKFGLLDFASLGSTPEGGTSWVWRHGERYDVHFGLMDAQGTEALWYATACNGTNQGYGSIYETRTLPFALTPHSYRWMDIDPIRRVFLGQPIGGAINKMTTYALALQRNLNYMFGYTSRVVAIDVARDTAVASFDNNYSEHAMFMNDSICIIDSMIVGVPSLTVMARHRFKGPFAQYTFEGYAVVWDSGLFYYIDVHGRLVDSTSGSVDKPTVFRVLPSRAIISGHQDGTVRIYSGKALPAPPPVPGTPTGSTFALRLHPQPSSSIVVIKTNLPPDEPLTTLTLCDNTGRAIVQWQEQTADEYSFDATQGSTAIPPGVYGLHVRCSTHSASGLVIVVR